jgi:signal transduction histidine kinase/CheY-like chemotaxis protein
VATKLTAEAPAGRRRIGRAALLVLVLGIGTTACIFVFARANVRDSERSLVRERTSQTFGVIQTVVTQVEAIVAAGAAAAKYTDGDPQAFRQAVAGRVETSLVSNLSLVRLSGSHVRLLASVGAPPTLLAKLTPADIAKLHRIAATGSDLKHVSGTQFPGGRIVTFAMSPRRGSDLLLYGEITATHAQEQAGGVAPSQLRFAISVGSPGPSGTLLLASPGGAPTGPGTFEGTIPMGAEELHVALGPKHRLISDFSWAAPWLMLAIGLVGSLALAALVEIGGRRRDEAIDSLAEQQRAEEEARVVAERLRHAQRLEAIGQLAGGVAHDFNNLLTAIIGGTRLLLRATRPGDPARAGLEDIERAADRAASLTRQLLAFSRKQVLQPTVLDLNRVVRETEAMLRHLIRADIRVVTSLDPELPPVEADASQVEQVIMNLIVNAADAIRGTGTIAITTQARRGPGGNGPARCAVLVVADDGTGMDEATRQRVFEPFFTTKELGRGTGLGLATVYGIVEQSGGSIEVESAPGAGSTFRIVLPGVEKEVAAPEPAPAEPESTAGTETVVVAEDDSMVRALIRVTLESSGYTVLEASSGEAAVELCESYGGPVDLLVTDMVMPGMGGRALADRLTMTRPDLRVLYVSGYAETEVLEEPGGTPGTAFVQKPFTPDELALRVRSLIDRPRPAAAPRAR